MLLLIDNYDSFTYNLVHYFAQEGVEVEVRRNDDGTAEDVLELAPKAIVISPGPCDPDQAGICLDLVAKAAGKVPIFGVCLGFQVIAQAFGGKVIRADAPMHGKVSEILHEDHPLFANIPSPFKATRYHSLIVERDSLPNYLEVTASTKEGVLMGISHTQHAIHGVQFHPESIESDHGHTICQNFLKMLG